MKPACLVILGSRCSDHVPDTRVAMGGSVGGCGCHHLELRQQQKGHMQSGVLWSRDPTAVPTSLWAAERHRETETWGQTDTDSQAEGAGLP